MPELIFILVLALLIFGPKRLPQVGRTIGRGLREFRQATSELKRTVETEMTSVDVEAPSPAAVPVPSAVPHSRAAEADPGSAVDSEPGSEPAPGPQSGAESGAQSGAQSGSESTPAPQAAASQAPAAETAGAETDGEAAGPSAE